MSRISSQAKRWTTETFTERYSWKKEPGDVHEVLDGLCEQWNESEQLIHMQSWMNGLPHGLEANFYPNGQLAFSCRRNFGLKEGLEEHLYMNGQVQYKCNWVCGIKDGVEERRAHNGNLVSRAIWHLGKQSASRSSFGSLRRMSLTV